MADRRARRSGQAAAPRRSSPDKAADLARETGDRPGSRLTTNQGLAVNDDQNTLKVGAHGPSLLRTSREPELHLHL